MHAARESVSEVGGKKNGDKKFDVKTEEVEEEVPMMRTSEGRIARRTWTDKSSGFFCCWMDGEGIAEGKVR